MEFLPLIAIALLFWLLILRPASKRQKDVARLQANLKSGDRVLLSSGLFGTVRVTEDDRVRVEIAPGVVVEVARGAVAAVQPDAEPSERADELGPHDPVTKDEAARDEAVTDDVTRDEGDGDGAPGTTRP